MKSQKSNQLADVLTVEDVALYLKVTERHIYKLLSENRLPAFKVGGAWRFRRVDLESWISSNLGETSKYGVKR